MKIMRNDFVTTGYVLNQTKDKILLIFHKKFNKWLAPGGHLDPNEIPHVGALREVFEETGVHARVINAAHDFMLANPTELQIPSPLCILYEVIPATTKEEEHMHIDFAYLMQADEQVLTMALNEIDNAGWFTLDQVMHLNTFDSVKKICTHIMMHSHQTNNLYNKAISHS